MLLCIQRKACPTVLKNQRLSLSHTEIDEHDEYSIDKEADYCDDMTEGLSLVV